MIAKRNQGIVPNDIFLNQKRKVADAVADQVANRIFGEANAREILATIATISKNGNSLPETLPEYLKEYFTCTSILPDWASNRHLKMSANFFSSHTQPIMMCLMMLSLPYCYAAGADAEVLLLSQRIGNDTRKRLTETGQFVFDVMDNDAFEPAGCGIRSIQKVRLMHAVVRFHLQKNGLWNNENGFAINQEAMAGTNLAFSLMILRGLQRQNISNSADQEDAYIHRWNVIGYLLGVNEDLLYDSIKETALLEELIRKRHFKKSKAGLELTAALVNTAKEFFPDQPVDQFLFPIMSHLLGKQVSDILEIPYSEQKSNIVSLLKLKNTFEQVFNIQSGSVKLAMKRQLQTENEGKKADFLSPHILHK